MDLLRQHREHDLVIQDSRKQSEMSPSMNQCVPFQTSTTSLKRGVAAPAGAEPVGAVGELDVVVRLQQQAHHLGDQLVRPRRHPQRA